MKELKEVHRYDVSDTGVPYKGTKPDNKDLSKESKPKYYYIKVFV